MNKTLLLLGAAGAGYFLLRASASPQQEASYRSPVFKPANPNAAPPSASAGQVFTDALTGEKLNVYQDEAGYAHYVIGFFDYVFLPGRQTYAFNRVTGQYTNTARKEPVLSGLGGLQQLG